MLTNILLDCDGCLTDGSKITNEFGECVHKTFYDKNWTIIKRFKAAGLRVAIISADFWNAGVFASRKVEFVFAQTLGANSKLNTVRNMGLERSDTLYLGDSIYDLELLSYVGFPYAPSDCEHELLKVCTVLDAPGGPNCLTSLYLNLVGKGLIKEAVPIEG